MICRRKRNATEGAARIRRRALTRSPRRCTDDDHDEPGARIAGVDFDGLRSGVKGGLLLPEDGGYDQARSVWNGMVDRKPAAIAQPLGVADVVEAVRFARQHDLRIAVKGGGHNIAGLAVADDALLLDMSRMRGVWVDPKERLAIAQPGCLLGDVDRETQVHGLATVLGYVSATGIAGLTLGGGFGYLTRRFGWTSDNVVGVDLVTATGEVVRASEDENPDLLWGVRGGGGNFGHHDERPLPPASGRTARSSEEPSPGGPLTRPRSSIATASWCPARRQS